MSPTQTAPEALTITDATVASQVPDSHTRRYDRQLRLWAASGQSALESARVLVLSTSATSCQALKNLVLPGIGTFTVLDAGKVSNEDAGNNFFLTQKSIGSSRAEETTRLLAELNENVKGIADTRGVQEVLAKDPQSLRDYTLVIAHNLPENQLQELSNILWGDTSYPPLVIVRSAGFLAEFSVQLHEHTVVDAHTEDLPSYRLDNAFPALKNYAVELNFDAMDVTDHGHVPYFVILVRALHDWKQTHNGSSPSYKDSKDFKDQILKMKKKNDEENFDEAVAQVFKVYQKTMVPPSVKELFLDPACVNLTPSSPPFFVMLHALSIFTQREPYTLPLSPTLPDLKSDTTSYIHLQTLYKTQARAEKAQFVQIVEEVRAKAGMTQPIPSVLVDEFVKNCHQLKILRGKQYGDEVDTALLEAIMTNPSQVATHLALSALFRFEASHKRWPTPGSEEDLKVLDEIVGVRLKKARYVEDGAQELSLQVDEAATGPENLTFKQHLMNSLGEIIRSPTSELPTTAALVGGLVAQEAIKLITRQYVPIDGICVIDLIASTTGTIKLA